MSEVYADSGTLTKWINESKYHEDEEEEEE
jgi:hypothetical protein